MGSRWQREIDWMALNGINAPLSFTGQEVVFLKTFEKFGVNLTEMQKMFSGPAFFAWQRMGNLQGFGGPISHEFIKNQQNLQKKIKLRQRQLGMWPIAPLFVGFLPPVFQELFPAAKISQISWANFQKPFGPVGILDADDPLFIKIGSAFLRELTNQYGDWSGPDGVARIFILKLWS